MQRRVFLGTCAAVSGAAGFPALSAWADAAPRFYGRAALVDPVGAPLRARSLATETNYVFQYPFVGTPCFLLDLGRPVAGSATLKREDGMPYEWRGGVGPARSIVAFSAICAHKLAYPTRDVSFIRYQRAPSTNSAAQVIHCCAEHSVYDPAAGARVVAGPAPQPLAAILLDYDAAKDELAAVGTVGAEQFDAFFRKYEFKLAMEYGEGRARRPVGATTQVKELAQYCRQTIQC
jgi:arsenite oxidase small subunit